MIAYVFRFLNDDGPTGWVGFALASDKEMLFHKIDQHGDPWRCEVRTTDSFSWCAKLSEDGESLLDDRESDADAFFDDGPWRDPPWVLRELEKHRVRRPTPAKFGYDKNAPF